MARPVAVLDTEVFHNYFLVAMKDVATGNVMTMEHPLDMERLKKIIKAYRIITFNGIGFDIPILFYAMTGVSTEDLKRASNYIIQNNAKPWNFAQKYGVELHNQFLDHVDLMEVAPLKGSLKLYGGRMHSKVIQDLPIPHEKVLTDEEKDTIRLYCINDLQTTVELYQSLKVQLELRDQMSTTYGIDLRSKSDAQIAEAVVKTEIERIKKERITKPAVVPGERFKYQVPAWMRFATLPLLDDVRRAEFQIDNKGKVLIPDTLQKRKITIGSGIYRMGIGGLHSSEECVSYKADSGHVLIDRDVTSYYPAIALNLGLYPKHIGPEFLQVYRKIVEDRIAAKKAGNKTVAESLKICVNGLFGKFGNRYSIVYSPELLIQVTLTGQLSLLMLIESLNVPGITVVSANTDGVFIRCRKDCVSHLNKIIAAWEKQTGFVTEEAQYEALYARDVNNYIAIKADGYGTKLKGCYGKGLPLQKNPTTDICSEAVIDYLTLGASIDSTIIHCRDIRKFISIRNVRDPGAEWQGKPIGKTIRWYYAKGIEEAILYRVNKYLVPKTFGAKPLMTLPDELPNDINYDWYIRTAEDILKEINADGSASPGRPSCEHSENNSEEE